MADITIDLSEYEELQAAAAKLRKLENAGVDNWEWYGEAMSGSDD